MCRWVIASVHPGDLRSEALGSFRWFAAPAFALEIRAREGIEESRLRHESGRSARVLPGNEALSRVDPVSGIDSFRRTVADDCP